MLISTNLYWWLLGWEHPTSQEKSQPKELKLKTHITNS